MLTRLHISLGLFVRSMLICVIAVLFFASSGVTYASSQVPNSSITNSPTLITYHSKATNNNWSGVIASNPAYAFTSVTGTFTLPCATFQLSDDEVSFWVGLGGLTSTMPLVQTVILYDPGASPPTYSAYGEISMPGGASNDHHYPSTGSLIPPAGLICGDRYLLAATQYSSATQKPLEVVFGIQNLTTGKLYSIGERALLPFPHGAVSAEWIAERPTITQQVGPYPGDIEKYYTPLAKFGTVDFSNCKVRHLSLLEPHPPLPKWEPLASLDYYPLDMFQYTEPPPFPARPQTLLSIGQAVQEGNQVDAKATWTNEGSIYSIN